MSRTKVAASLTPEQAQRYLSTHSETFDVYPIRSVVIYGLAECERSRGCPRLLSSNAVSEFGKWMNISHDGDRVVRWDGKGNSWPYELDYSDAGVDLLIAEAERANGENLLALHPGAYACSISQIDQMVDIALSVRGVAGAQLSGAGLGGCVMVLVHKDSRPALEKAMIRGYYDPANLEPDLFACSPVAGAGPIRL